MTAPTRPGVAFDPDSPDADILAAFARIQDIKAWCYSYDGIGEAHLPEGMMQAFTSADAEQMGRENTVTGDMALTPTAVFAQLALELTRDCDRWIDIELATHGFRSIYRRRKEMPGDKMALVEPMNALLHMEWERSLADYERSAADFLWALELKNIADEISDKLATAKAVANEHECRLFKLSVDMEEHFSNGKQVRRVIRTLAPDVQAYTRKIAIINAEGHPLGDVIDWLARDTRYLIGRADG